MHKIVGSMAVVAVLAGGVWAKGEPKKPPARVITVTSKSPQAVAAYQKAMAYLDNARRPEALAELRRALEADPDFALAAARLSVFTPNAEGEALADKALVGSAKLPDAERLQIELDVARRKGDAFKAKELRAKLLETAPDEWRLHISAAQAANDEQKHDEAVAHAKKALELNPKAAAGYNQLAYTYAAQAKWDDAIAAAKKQAQLLPNEPNPQDTHGEVLLWAGKLADAEAAFQKALKLSPSFGGAWQGVALARYYRGDWAGGDEALAKQKQVATLPDDKVGAAFDIAWGKLVQGKPADALAELAALDKDVDRKSPQYAGLPIGRAWLNLTAEKPADALADATLAMDRGAKGDYPPAFKAAIQRFALVAKAIAESRLGKLADAEKTMAMIDEEAKKLPGDHGYQVFSARAHANLAMAKGDLKAAAPHFAVCRERRDLPCIAEEWQAQQKAGDQAAAQKDRDILLARHYRDIGYLILRKQVDPAAAKAK